MRSSSMQWCARPAAMLTLMCGLMGPVSAQEYTCEVLNPLVALPGIPATAYGHVSTSGGAVGNGYGTATGSIPHAMYMPPGATMPIDLHPAGFLDTYANGAEGDQQVGNGWSNGENQYRALLWRGSAASVVSLHPAGYFYSHARATDGSFQVGSANFSSGGGHAVLWNGTAASAVTLHPSGYQSTSAVAVGDGQQVGVAFLASAPVLSRAMMWSGTPESAVDLHPAGFNESYANGVGGGRQAGYGKVLGPNPTRALVWSGTAASVVNLHPAGATGSIAYDTNAEVQVGDRTPGGATAWRGSAESFINLHALLPAGSSFSTSRAISIDNDGVIHGLAYGTHGGVTAYHVVRWTPTGGPDCPAQYNGDEDVDILDFLDFMDDFSVCEDEPAPCGAFGDADINGDTFVDILDFLDFIDSFGTGC